MRILFLKLEKNVTLEWASMIQERVIHDLRVFKETGHDIAVLGLPGIKDIHLIDSDDIDGVKLIDLPFKED